MIIFVSKICVGSGDVTCPSSTVGGCYAELYAVFPQACDVFVNSEIPVDNWEFSTFSTDFSTRVFHRLAVLWIFIIGSHNQADRIRKKSPLLRQVVVFTMAVTPCKK